MPTPWDKILPNTMRTLSLIAALCAACCLAAATRSVFEGVYTPEQATRGLAVYREECAKCHGENLAGGEVAPALVGKEFTSAWKGRAVGDLLGIIIKTMPTDDPGNLSRRQYADVTAFILKSNEYPAGTKDLDSAPAASKDTVFDEKK
jgi:mono/diheme cytochrome c family protein